MRVRAISNTSRLRNCKAFAAVAEEWQLAKEQGSAENHYAEASYCVREPWTSNMLSSNRRNSR